MKTIFWAAAVALMGATAFGQTSAAGQSIWRHDGATSVTGQSIWRHEGLPGTAPGSLKLNNTRRVSRGHMQPQPVIVGLGIGGVCDAGYDPTADYLAYQEARTFYLPGYDWGAGIKGNKLAWTDFLGYLEQYILSASPIGRDAFRQGFVEAFGGNGEATYDYALRQASRPG